MAPIDPVADYEKLARNVSSDALRGRISRLCIGKLVFLVEGLWV